MYWVFLVVSFISSARMQIMTNVDDATTLQLKYENLKMFEAEISKEINDCFSQIGDPLKWLQQNTEAIPENSLLLELRKDFSSAMYIFNYTQAFVEKTSTTISTSCIKRENERSEAITKALEQAERRAEAIGTNLTDCESRLAAARAQQLTADERLNQAQARLAGLRSDADALKKREGALEQRLEDLLNALHAQKVRVEAIQEGKRQAETQVKNIKKKTDETEKAIEQATNELQKIKTRSHRVANLTVASGVNFVKSVKTASGRGKHIKLILLSD